MSLFLFNSTSVTAAMATCDVTTSVSLRFDRLTKTISFLRSMAFNSISSEMQVMVTIILIYVSCKIVRLLVMTMHICLMWFHVYGLRFLFG